MRDEFKSLLSQIDRFIKLPDSEINQAGRLGAAISRAAIELKNSFKFNGKAAELGRLTSAVDTAEKKLEQSVFNFKRGGALRVDWFRFAQIDFQRLKDEVLSFREFLISNVDSIEDIFRFGDSRDIDLEVLVKKLHDERVISERTWAMFMCHINECRSKKMLRDPNVAQQLARIQGWLSELHEIKRAEADVGQKA